MKRRRRKERGRKKFVNRKPGYYWIRVGRERNDRWIIGRWWQSLQFFDTMGTIADKGWRDKILEVDENIIERLDKIKRRRTK
jgi:hypothetical protein